jgi:mRNA-degrading endonuclease RelE of RelBE toxin-antitoxin system
MTYSLIPTSTFKKELKRLRKKYPSLNTDLEKLGEQIMENPRMGDEIFEGCFKIRFAIKSKGKGKSGGGRLITFVKVEGKRIYLLTVYDKSDQEDISIAYLRAILKDLNL